MRLRIHDSIGWGTNGAISDSQPYYHAIRLILKDYFPFHVPAHVCANRVEQHT